MVPPIGIPPERCNKVHNDFDSDREKSSAWGTNVQFFCSGASIPAPANSELAVEIDCVALNNRLV